MIFDLTRLVLAWFTLVEPHMPWPRETSQKSNDVSILGRISYTGNFVSRIGIYTGIYANKMCMDEGNFYLATHRK